MSGCDNETNSKSGGAGNNKTKIIVGTTGMEPGWSEVSDDQSKNNGLQGYDVDIMSEIARRNNWDVEWKIAELQALFGMLDSGDVTTVANCIAVNKERAEKYDFTSPYSYSSYVFVTPKGKNANNLEWFKGKSVCVYAPGDQRISLEAMNNEHDLQLNIGYLDTQAPMISSVANGTYDAAFVGRNSAALAIKELKVDLDIFDPHYKSFPMIYPFTKTDKNANIRENMDKALQAMRADGTLKKISMKWFGFDVSEK